MAKSRKKGEDSRSNRTIGRRTREQIERWLNDSPEIPGIGTFDSPGLSPGGSLISASAVPHCEEKQKKKKKKKQKEEGEEEEEEEEEE